MKMEPLARLYRNPSNCHRMLPPEFLLPRRSPLFLADMRREQGVLTFHYNRHWSHHSATCRPAVSSHLPDANHSSCRYCPIDTARPLLCGAGKSRWWKQKRAGVLRVLQCLCARNSAARKAFVESPFFLRCQSCYVGHSCSLSPLNTKFVCNYSGLLALTPPSAAR